MRFIYRLGTYLIGIMVLTFGNALTFNSNLGASAITALTFAMNQVTGITLGLMSFIMFTSYVLLQAILLKKDFKPIQYLQILFAVLFGQFLQVFNSLLQIEINNLMIRFLMVIAGITCVAIGIFLTVTPRLVPLAPDGMTQAVSIKAKIDFGKAKNFVDITCVTLAITLLLLTGNNLNAVGIGTVLSAIFVGRILYLLNRYLKSSIEKVLFPQEECIEEDL